MKKHEFLAKLEKELAKLPDHDEIIAYYEELINEALSSGELEEDFINHLGTPSEIKYKLSHDDSFKDNIKTKKNVSARQSVSVVVKVLSCALYIFVAIILFTLGLGLITTGVFTIFTSIYRFVVDTMTISTVFYYIFTIIFKLSLIVFGILIFVYLFKFSKQQAEKLQILLAGKLNKGDDQV
ncbi:MAG: DUF1700 domain-containing protein [Bacilli bacterium]|jgi:uncharacterized membrane protein|nr:DUF1700 domain-containing protein [Bacilli bacterium]